MRKLHMGQRFFSFRVSRVMVCVLFVEPDHPLMIQFDESPTRKSFIASIAQQPNLSIRTDRIGCKVQYLPEH